MEEGHLTSGVVAWSVSWCLTPEEMAVTGGGAGGGRTSDQWWGGLVSVLAPGRPIGGEWSVAGGQSSNHTHGHKGPGGYSTHGGQSSNYTHGHKGPGATSFWCVLLF